MKKWEVTKFGKIIKLEYGFGLTANERKGNEFPVYGSGGISGYHSQYKVEGPGVIVARKGSLGNVHYSEKNFWSIDTVFYISKRETKQDLAFLYYLLQNLHLEKLEIVTALPGISRDDIYQLRILKPPLPEQKRIASILASVDTTLEQTKNIIKKNQRIKKGLMQKLLTESNHFTKVDNFLKINMGQSPPSDSYNKNRIGLPFLQGVTDFGEIYPNYITWCSNPKKIAGKNQILFSVRAPVGDINITKSKCCIGRGIASLDPGENNLFYCYYLLNQNKNRFLAFSKGTTYDAINKDEILCTELPFTKDKKKQQQIASILFSVDNKILTEKQNYEKLVNLQKGLMEDLLTPTLRVNI